MADLRGFELAARNQITRNLNDFAHSRKGVISLLMGLDKMYKTPGTRFRMSSDFSGKTRQFDFRAATAAAVGVKASSGSVASQAQTLAQSFALIAGEIGYSAYVIHDVIRKWDINRLSKDPSSVVPLVKKVARGMVDGCLQTWDNHLIPTTYNVGSNTDGATATLDHTPTATYVAANDGTDPGYYQEDRIMSLTYPLQGTVANLNNAGAGSQAYNYGGINLNSSSPDYRNLRSIQKGILTGQTGGLTAFVPSHRNIRTQITMPLKHRNGKPDIGICDIDTWDYLANQAEGKIVLAQEKALEFGCEDIMIGGLHWMVSENLQTLADSGGSNVREMLILDSGTWEFTARMMDDEWEALPIPGSPSLRLLQGYLEACILTENPRYNARAVNLNLS